MPPPQALLGYGLTLALINAGSLHPYSKVKGLNIDSSSAGPMVRAQIVSGQMLSEDTHYSSMRFKQEIGGAATALLIWEHSQALAR